MLGIIAEHPEGWPGSCFASNPTVRPKPNFGYNFVAMSIRCQVSAGRGHMFQSEDKHATIVASVSPIGPTWRSTKNLEVMHPCSSFCFRSSLLSCHLPHAVQRPNSSTGSLPRPGSVLYPHRTGPN